MSTTPRVVMSRLPGCCDAATSDGDAAAAEEEAEAAEEEDAANAEEDKVG